MHAIFKPLLSAALIVLVPSVLLSGCDADAVPSTESKQITACVEDVKLGLGDPNSIEVISTNGIKTDFGTYRLELKFTAKNAMGGRVRGEAVCGFKTEQSTTLDPTDVLNRMRKAARQLEEIRNR